MTKVTTWANWRLIKVWDAVRVFNKLDPSNAEFSLNGKAPVGTVVNITDWIIYVAVSDYTDMDNVVTHILSSENYVIADATSRDVSAETEIDKDGDWDLSDEYSNVGIY